MKANSTEKSPYARLDAKPITAPKGKPKAEPKAAKTVSAGDMRAKGGK